MLSRVCDVESQLSGATVALLDREQWLAEIKWSSIFKPVNLGGEYLDDVTERGERSSVSIEDRVQLSKQIIGQLFGDLGELVIHRLEPRLDKFANASHLSHKR
jgi:hypothetical protein